MTWVVVKFIISNEVEVVPTIWYNVDDDICLYPSFHKDAKKMEKAIKNRMVPEEGWVPYKVQLMSHTRYDSFQLANAKASKACVRSDISDIDEGLPVKRVPKKICISTDEESDESLKNVPHPPKKDVQPKKDVKKLDSRQVCSKELTQLEKVNDNTPEVDYSKFQNYMVQYMVKNKVMLQEQDKTLNGLKRDIDKIQLTVDKILQRIGNAGEDITLNNGVDCVIDIVEKLPIESIEIFDTVEDALQNKDKFTQLVAYLSRLGGSSYKECVRRILCKILKNNVAELYSLHGHKGKRVFVTAKLFQVITESVKLSGFGVTTKEIELCTAVWLTKASERDKKKKKVQEKETDE